MTTNTCRALGHAWEPNPFGTLPKYGHIKLTMICPRCGTTRTDSLSVRGKLIGRAYGYNEAYRILPTNKKKTKLTREDWRRFLLEEMGK